MQIDRRITNGLAWAGVLLVVGVPTADLLSAQFFGPAAASAPAQVAVISPVAPVRVAPVPAPLSQRPAAPAAKPAVAVAKPAVAQPAVAVAKPVAPVVTKPVAQPAAQTVGVVTDFLQSGKALPSYITDGGTATQPAPAQVAVASPQPAPAQVAVAAPPVRTPIVTTPVAVAPVVDPVQVAAIPPQKVAPMPMPLSMRPAPVIVPLTAAAPSNDIVLPPGLVASPPSAVVTANDLDDWETGPLSEFLARKQGSSATVTTDYDPNGFFLDEAPAPPARDRVIGWEEPGFSYFAD